MKSILFFVLISFVSGCIIQAPKRYESDLYAQWQESRSGYSIKFIEITSYDVKTINPAEVCLFASWCPGSIYRLRLEDINKPTNTLFISSNYDLKSMNRLFKNNLDTIYLLSNSRYGSTESIKIKQFVSELLCEENNMTGVPQEFVKTDSCFVRKISLP